MPEYMRGAKPIAWLVCYCGSEYAVFEEDGSRQIVCGCSNKVQVEFGYLEMAVNLFDLDAFDLESYIRVATEKPVAIIYDNSYYIACSGPVVNISSKQLKKYLNSMGGGEE